MNSIIILLTALTFAYVQGGYIDEYGGYGRQGGYGGYYGMSSSDLSDEELSSLCYESSCPGCSCPGCSCPGCCCEYDDSNELCGCGMPCGMGGMGSFQPFGGCEQRCCGCQQPCGCAPVIRCEQPRQFASENRAYGGQCCGQANDKCANAYGAGACGARYNQGAVCGHAGGAKVRADACKKAGTRAFAKKFADECMVRRCNEGCATGTDCYEQGRVNACCEDRRMAGQRSCGDAGSCHANAAGMKCRDAGIAGQVGGGCCATRTCGTPCGCGCQTY